MAEFMCIDRLAQAEWGDRAKRDSGVGRLSPGQEQHAGKHCFFWENRKCSAC